MAEGVAVRSGNGDRLHVLKAELRELLTKEEKLGSNAQSCIGLKKGTKTHVTFMVKLLRGVGKIASNA